MDGERVRARETVKDTIEDMSPSSGLKDDMSAFFDKEFYNSQVQGGVPLDAIEHYSQVGWKLGLDPSPTFSTSSYLEDYPDVRDDGKSPLRHYVSHGLAEGRTPKPSKRISKAAKILLASGEVDVSVVVLIERTYKPIREKSNVTGAQNLLERYLAEGWKNESQRSLHSRLEWAAQGPSKREQLSKTEVLKILAAAQKYISNQELFDNLKAVINVEYYERRCEAIGILSHADLDIDIVSHYFAVGRHFRISATPLFDISLYIDAANELAVDRVDPADALIHYFYKGENLGIRPCALFCPSYYDAVNSVDACSPLVHYITQGARKGNQPSVAFWGDWYCAKHKVDAVNPLVHFYQSGINEELCPNPLFDAEWYRTHYCVPADVSAMKHYVTKGFLKDFAPTILINVEHIKRQLIERRFSQLASETVVESYLRNAREINPHVLFDTAYYLMRHDRLAKIAQPLFHYFSTSRIDPKFPSPYFSDQAYYDARPDTVQYGHPALIHYLRSGFHEDVRVHPLVDHNYLRANLPNSGNLTPLEAFMSNVLDERTPLRPVSSQLDSQNKSKWHPVILDVEAAAAKCGGIDMAGIKVGIFAHVFYVNLLSEIIEFACNVRADSVLLVTTDTLAKRLTIVALLESSGLLKWEVRVVENRGRDIAPSFLGFADQMDLFDYGVHIHTKRSKHYGQSFDQWRKYLFSQNGGSPERVEAILRVFEANPTLGALAPADFGPIRKLISWGHNQSMVEALLALAGRQESLGDVSLEFPSGSMFWFRTRALRGLYRAGLQKYHFEPEDGQVDGTLSHAIERAFFMLVETEGYDWARFYNGNRLGGYLVTDEVRFARSRLLPPHRTRSLLAVRSPEVEPFYCRAIANMRPRLNLLIPTCDLQLGYAGVSEAIRQFRAIGDKLGSRFDLRIIVTDTPFTNMTVPPQDFTAFDSLVEDSDMALVPGYRRRAEPLGLRRNDCFVVSAWWNAKQAFEILDEQASIYGNDGFHRIIYLIQDFEPGFYAWSTRWALAESTYRNPEKTIAVYNTPLLAEFMTARFQFSMAKVYRPMINEKLLIAAKDQVAFRNREKIVLLYARPHAERNCLDMIDAIVCSCIEQDPSFWSDWRFLAIGESFQSNLLRCRAIEVLGRLSLDEYREHLAKAKLGVCIMISPHPSYPPLEMAAGGMRVLTNSHDSKNLAFIHENIESFNTFIPSSLADRLKAMALETKAPGKALVDWFFDGQNNLDEVADAVASEVQRDLSNSVGNLNTNAVSEKAASRRRSSFRS